ncbi:MAG: hypothetical protein EOO48_04250 [Flavobacterium sp.]|nr:MAG: hypothetical protein EOO48_04250 [Flavobacterium sp.]
MRKLFLIALVFPVIGFAQKQSVKNEKLTFAQYDFVKEVNKLYPDIVMYETALTHFEDGHVTYYQIQLKSSPKGYDFIASDYEKTDIYYRIFPDNKHIYYSANAKGIHGDIYKIGNDYYNFQVSANDQLTILVNGKPKM